MFAVTDAVAVQALVTLGVVLAAALSTVGLVISARTNKGVKDVHAEVVTNHGKRQGQRVEELGDSVRSLAESVDDLRADFRLHTAEDRGRYEALVALIGHSVGRVHDKETVQ